MQPKPAQHLVTSREVGSAHAIDAGIREGQAIAPYVALPLVLILIALAVLVIWKLARLVW